MGKAYTWPDNVASRIAALPDLDRGIPEADLKFWEAVEEDGTVVVPLEVLAYLIRVAYAHEQRAAVDRLASTLWKRSGRLVATMALRSVGGYLRGDRSIEDVVSETYRILFNRLRASRDVTFYEVLFARAVGTLVIDQRRQLARDAEESQSSQSGEQEDGDPEPELRDLAAPDPEEEALDAERRDELRRLVPARLADLTPRAQRAALLLGRFCSDGTIARELGVTTRMVRNYKEQIRRALSGLP
jgi:DNA-directed RNA polymerase specialized sigma24 family protein